VANHVDAIPAGGPAAPARRLVRARARIERRLLVDRLARRLVTLGGSAIILSILAILLVIVVEVYPLFEPPTAQPVRRLSGPVRLAVGAPALAIGVEEYRELGYVVTADGVRLFRLQDGAPVGATVPPTPGGARVVAAALRAGGVALGLSDGRVVPVDIRFPVAYPEGRRAISGEVVPGGVIDVDPAGRPLRALAVASPATGPVTVAALGGADLVVIAARARKALIGPPTPEVSRQAIALPGPGEVTVLEMDERGEDAFAGTAAGDLWRIDLRDPFAPRVAESVAASRGAGIAVTALALLIGDRTLVVGDAAGGVASWQVVSGAAGDRRLRRIHDFLPHVGPVSAIAPSARDKGFVTADHAGFARLHYGTGGRTLLSVQVLEERLGALTFAPRADGLVAVGNAGGLAHFRVDNPHPEITWRSLFGRLWYEGYPEPAFVWQSTGGTDDFEAKFSLTPLLYGTLKGTFYALVFAVPVALLAALYASQFMHPRIKSWVKPTVELMAALPSVVLGFIAGLWLAPMVERYVPGLLLLPWVVAALTLVAAGAWQWAPVEFRRRFRAGTELALLVPLVLAGGWLALELGGVVEATLLRGDYRGWLLQSLGLTYDQRNSLVVGVAMGFAVIPLIFTIAEDSLSNVPQHLTAGSLALGATRWQTALRVVLPTASPGIFSAIMIGFGRAVGETMIVLMATGNTPLMDWSIFNGFRALSANIAVELPEAPEGGTLYRVLFLAALLLFAMTFVVNTLAELVRLRLRRKYRYL
jgi:phosphate transport system permease protein